MKILLLCIMMIESGGEPDPLNAIGDNGYSLGCMQISKAVVDDCNRVQDEFNFTYEDRRSKEKSFKMAEIYLRYWINRYEINTGKKATLKDYAMCWNGGCHWYKAKEGSSKRNNLNKYWSKIVKELNKYGR
tara:strand:- start:314 stop:706 length:393 start_codon:yes stop_codon:yes gene_type:complete